MADNFWTEPRIVSLRQAVADKCSASQIAVRVGDGCTRSAVIGYAHRHHIALNPPSHISDETKRVRRLARVEKLRRRLASFDERSKAAAKVREVKRRPMVDELAVLEAEVAAVTMREIAA